MGEKRILIGPITQLVTLDHIPVRGSIKDEEIEIIQHAGMLISGSMIEAIGPYDELQAQAAAAGIQTYILGGPVVAIPGLIDCHTHICYGGNRARDYASRNAGKTYLEIAAEGGGIWDSVVQTRKATMEALVEGIHERAGEMLAGGVTTLEIKSGYGQSVEGELKMLRAIKKASEALEQTVVATCLAAHIIPREYTGRTADYLQEIIEQVLPAMAREKLANRVDAFIEQNAYREEDVTAYFKTAKQMGFDITVHADQFTTGGSAAAVRAGALSADHLEASTEEEINLLSQSDVIPVALPGASLGLGCAFTPARKLLDAGCSLAIASDYNPGSAPMGNLLVQASVLGSFQKLSNAEVLAGITFRAAAALGLHDRGRLKKGMRADVALFPTDNYQNITYKQGSLKPHKVICGGALIHTN